MKLKMLCERWFYGEELYKHHSMRRFVIWDENKACHGH